MISDLGSLIRKDAVHRSIYTDPEIFDLEMERIFDRTWIYLAHLSEIKEAGDYRTTVIGRHPVIVSHLGDGKVHVMINRCRHRGATICQHELGNSRVFRCAYHSWTYANTGKLIGVPHPEGYGDGFSREELGLAKVPRVAVHRGFIFGSMASEGPSLDDYLGGTKKLLDEFCDVSPTGQIDVFRGQQKCAYNGNWKFQLDNGVDPYHVEFLHRSTFTRETLKIYSESKGIVIDMDGHGVTDHRDIGPPRRDGLPNGGFNVVVFPNLILLRTQIRTVRPIAADRTRSTLMSCGCLAWRTKSINSGCERRNSSSGHVALSSPMTWKYLSALRRACKAPRSNGCSFPEDLGARRSGTAICPAR